jgi:NADH dehydrogenase (ubiquinone) 1 alpha subcomplex subunit 8
MASQDLYAASAVLRTECASVNAAFVQCKQAHGGRNANPSACLAEGERVTACVVGVQTRLKESCPEPFGAYKACLKSHSQEGAMQYAACQDAADAVRLCWAGLKSA